MVEEYISTYEPEGIMPELLQLSLGLNLVSAGQYAANLVQVALCLYESGHQRSPTQALQTLGFLLHEDRPLIQV
jgi:hypothetical protein